MYVKFFFRLNMSEESQINSSNVLSKEQIHVNHSKTQTLIHASFMHGEHEAFKEHMENNPVHHNFNGTLAHGIELVMSKERTLSDVAPTLIILLQNGAKLAHDHLTIPGEMTPYHVICRSTGDHQELLELMVKELGRSLLNARDDNRCTALMYAVSNANIKCVKCLIANRADVNLMNDKPKDMGMLGPLIDTINLLQPKSPHSYNTMMDIFDLLLDSGADVNIPCLYHNRTPILYAVAVKNVNCVKKLIQKGAEINCRDRAGYKVWPDVVRDMDMLKCLIEDNDIDKNSTDKRGLSILFWAVSSCRIEPVRYLLNQGVTMTSIVLQECVEVCKNCGTNVSCHDHNAIQLLTDPYVHAIILDIVDIVKLMDEYGCQLGKSPEILSIAIHTKSVEVVEYLLCNYKYPLNYGYIEKLNGNKFNSGHQTFLSKACENQHVEIVKLLLVHGADPNKKYCGEKFPIVINAAIYRGHVKYLACFIRGGVSVNTRSHYSGRFRTSDLADIGVVLPFEAAVYENHIYVVEMLLASGCTCGIHIRNNHKLKSNIGDKMQELLKEWNVFKNNVLPLKQRCRMVILNHLCPQADKKITQLPLPPQLIKYLNIPELDDIVEKDLSVNHLKYY